MILFICSTAFATQNVGVIIPMEHSALSQIVQGIEDSLSGEDIKLVIKNAHGDNNIMSTIIRQMADMDIIIPIGTQTSQMAIAHIHNKPIVCTAAKIDPKNGAQVTGVNDEIPVSSSFSKLPMLKDVTVVYSASEKVAPEVDELKKYAASNGINLHSIMIQSLADLPVYIKNADEKTQAFLILKDHLIVSGVNVILQEAWKRKIPLIASDEGSITQGATIAIGVNERDIGVNAGMITKEILHGKKASEIHYKTMDKLSLFVNVKSFAKQNILTQEELYKLGLPLVEVGKD
jgi:putative ABC transport system substrate-binding protein